MVILGINIRYTLALWTAVLLMAGCSSRNESHFTMNTTPELPSTDPFLVIEGLGTIEIYLGQTRAAAETLLGAHVSEEAGLLIYQKEDITYTLKYQSNVVVQIQIECDRFLTSRIVGTETQFLVPFGATREEMVARQGAEPDRDQNLTWWYDDRGVGFIYVHETGKIKGVVIFPGAPPDYSLDSVYIADIVDLDGDGQWSYYTLNFSVDVPSGQDYVWVQVSFQNPGASGWVPFDSSANVPVYADSINQYYLEYYPSASWEGSLKVDLYSQGNYHLDSSIIPIVYEENLIADAIMLDTVYLSDLVDNDLDGFLSAFNVYFEVSTPVADSVVVQLSSRTTGATTWDEPFFTSVVIPISEGSNGDLWVELIGTGDPSVSDVKVDLYYRTGMWIATDSIIGIQEESAVNDGGIDRTTAGIPFGLSAN